MPADQSIFDAYDPYSSSGSPRHEGAQMGRGADAIQFAGNQYLANPEPVSGSPLKTARGKRLTSRSSRKGIELAHYHGRPLANDAAEIERSAIEEMYTQFIGKSAGGISRKEIEKSIYEHFSSKEKSKDKSKNRGFKLIIVTVDPINPTDSFVKPMADLSIFLDNSRHEFLSDAIKHLGTLKKDSEEHKKLSASLESARENGFLNKDHVAALEKTLEGRDEKSGNRLEKGETEKGKGDADNGRSARQEMVAARDRSGRAGHGSAAIGL